MKGKYSDMARWRSRAIDAAIMGGLALSFGFAARPRGNSLARAVGVGFTAAAWARLLANRKRTADGAVTGRPSRSYTRAGRR